MHRREGHRNIRRRVAASLGLAGLLALAALGLTQCRMVDDRITGVDLRGSERANARSECVRACNDEFQACRVAVDERRDTGFARCETLPSATDRAQCKKLVLERHHDEHLRCVARKNQCKDECYNEGSGTLGS